MLIHSPLNLNAQVLNQGYQGGQNQQQFLMTDNLIINIRALYRQIEEGKIGFSI